MTRKQLKLYTMDYNEYQIQEKEKSEKVVNDFANLVNNMSFEPEHFIKCFARQHRTLQQKMFSTMMAVMVSMTKDEYGTDGRNH